MWMNLRFPVVALAFLALSAPLVAHHSVPVNYDMSREITIEGALTEIVWINPHSRFGLDVTGDDGSTEAWLIEMGALNTMRRAGFKTELFVIGDVVTVTGWPARRGCIAEKLSSIHIVRLSSSVKPGLWLLARTRPVAPGPWRRLPPAP